MLSDSLHSWVEIDRAKIVQNIKKLKQIVGKNVALAAVIKSNAYGHGIPQVVEVLQDTLEVDWAVAYRLQEAIAARSSGFTKPILVCGFADGDVVEAALQNIDMVVYDNLSIERFEKIAKNAGKSINVHIKVDTGLTRLGFSPDKALDAVIKLKKSRYLVLRGMLSHFAESDARDTKYLEQQLQHFEDLVCKISELGIKVPVLHLANTISAIRFPYTHNSMVRVGGGIYGLHKNIGQDGAPDAYRNLQPVVTWKSRIMQIREIKPNVYISYGRTFRSSQKMKIAVVPVGYSDGYDRNLSNNSFMFVNGGLVPVVGRVCMNMTMIDVTGIAAQVGDEVTLLGDIDGIRVSDFMDRLDTISYDITTRINWTIPRLIV